MKWNTFLYSIKIYLGKYGFPKFETSGIKKNDFTSLQSWAFCLPKMVRGMGRVNPKITRRDVTLVPNVFLYNQSFLSARSVYVRKMSSDSEMSDLSEWSSNTEEGETEEEEDVEIIDVEIMYSQLTSYQEEPLAEVDTSDNTRDANDIEEGESDEDGLTAATLEARYETKTLVNLCSLNSSFILDFYAVILGLIHLKSQRQTGLTRSHITHHTSHNTLLISQAFIQVPLTFRRSKIKILRHSFRFVLVVHSSFDVVELLGANVNNARTRM